MPPTHLLGRPKAATFLHQLIQSTSIPLTISFGHIPNFLVAVDLQLHPAAIAIGGFPTFPLSAAICIPLFLLVGKLAVFPAPAATTPLRSSASPATPWTECVQ